MRVVVAFAVMSSIMGVVAINIAEHSSGEIERIYGKVSRIVRDAGR